MFIFLKAIVLIFSLENFFVNSLVRIVKSDGLSVDYPSVSLFQQDTPKFQVEGIPVEMTLKPVNGSNSCKVGLNLTNFLPTEGVEIKNTIVFLDYTNSGCLFHCILETFEFYRQFVAYLSKKGYPNPDTYVLIRRMVVKGDPGDPFYDFASTSLSDKDIPPPTSLKFQMVDLFDTGAILEDLRSSEGAVIQVTQEKGIWNEYFLSGFDKFARIFSIIVLGFYIILSFYNAYVAYLDQVIQLDLRNVVFIIGLFALIVYLAILCIPRLTRISIFLSDVYSLLVVVVLNLLLFLWTVCLVDYFPANQIRILRIVIGVNLILRLTTRALDIVLNLQNNMPLHETRDVVLAYILVILQLTSAGIYLFFGIYFVHRSKSLSLRATKQIVYTLHIIKLTAFTGFFGNLVISVYTFPVLRKYAHYAFWTFLKVLILNFIYVSGSVIFLLIITTRGKTQVVRNPTKLEKVVNKFKHGIFHFFKRIFVTPIQSLYLKSPKA